MINILGLIKMGLDVIKNFIKYLILTTNMYRYPRTGRSNRIYRKQELDIDRASADILSAGRGLLREHPDVGAIVLECTNMPPYASALREEFGLPVFDIYSMITWFHTGLRPRAFGGNT